MKNLIVFILSLVLVFSSFAQTERENNIFNQINELRTNPKSLIPSLISFRETKIQYLINASREKDSIYLYKYIDAINETIQYLDTVKPVLPLTLDNGLYKILSKYDYSKTFDGVYIKHTDFVNNYESYGENLNIGARGLDYAIIQLVVDFKIESKGHRSNLMNSKWLSMAIFEVNIEGNPITYVQGFHN